MAYDEILGDRIRARLDTTVGVIEKRMFGGLAFLIGGNLAVVASGSGLSYQWSRAGVAIAGATHATLVVSAVRLADDGATFTVTVSNPAGSVTSAPAALGVDLAPPVLETAPADVSTVEGESVRFEVSARGSLLRYQWLRNGAPIVGETASSLDLASVSLLDDGVAFAVTVANDAGSVTSSPATLTVRRAPPPPWPGVG